MTSFIRSMADYFFWNKIYNNLFSTYFELCTKKNQHDLFKIKKDLKHQIKTIDLMIHDDINHLELSKSIDESKIEDLINILKDSLEEFEEDLVDSYTNESNDKKHIISEKQFFEEKVLTNKEISKMWTLSTSHLSEDTVNKFEDGDTPEGFVIFQKEDYGFFLYIIEEDIQDRRDFPEELVEIYLEAFQNDISVLCFDRYGEIVEGLKTYVW